MRTHTQLKVFFAGVLNALTTLTIVTTPAPRMDAAQPFTKRITLLAQRDLSTLAQVIQDRLLTSARTAERSPVNRHQGKKSDAQPMNSNQPRFLPAVSYSSGAYWAWAAEIGDLNGDGKLDLVVANDCGDPNNCYRNGAVSVLLGNGDGTFQPATSYWSGGGEALSVAIADVNGDGKPDLLVANYYGRDDISHGAVGVLLGNGDGTFQPAIAFSSGSISGLSLAVGDVNGDGKPDLVVSHRQNFVGDYDGTITLLLGNGDGTFQSPVLFEGTGDTSVALKDVNGDGKLDIVATLSCSRGICIREGSVTVLLGNGDGTFQQSMSYDSGGKEPSSMALADLNGDGKVDLVVTNSYGASSVAGVLLGNGDGTFQHVVTHGLGGAGTTSIAVADVNGDGKADLLVINNNESTLGILLGNGDGAFHPEILYNLAVNGPHAVRAADVDRNGSPDLLIANGTGCCPVNAGTVSVLINSTSLTSTALASSSNPSTYGQKVTWTATVTSSGSVMPTGTVRFTWQHFTETFTIGSATLNSSGVATLTKSNLNADSYPLTAVYAGDADNLGSTSAVLNQVVLETTSTATLTSSPNPSTLGQAVSFTAKISSPTVIPTGPVTFTAGKTVLGTAQLSGGKATLTISSLAVGSTKVTATYYGDSNIAKSSASVIQTVH